MSTIAHIPTSTRAYRTSQPRQAPRSSLRVPLNSSFLATGKVKTPFGDVARMPCKRSTSGAVQGGALTAEANLFSRVWRVGKSYANSLVSSAEDPEKILDQAVIEMQEDLTKMRQASAQVMASQKQLENKWKQAQTTSDDWYKRAQLALSKGDEDLAKQALLRKKQFQESADSLKSQLDAQADATKNLLANTRTLEQKLAEAKSKKDTLKARAASAKTSKQVSEMVGSLGNSNSYAAFDRMEEKVMAMEADAEATSIIAGGQGDALAEQFKSLEGGGDVDFELAEMKAGLKSGKESKGSLPEGRKIEDAIDMELEELRRKARE